MKIDEDFDVADLNRLIRVLEAEERGYAEIESLEENKRESLVQGDTVSLENWISRQESLVPGLRRLEAERQQLMQEWHSQAGERPTPTLSEIIERGEPVMAERIGELKEVLADRVMTLGRIVRGNEVLVNQSLHHVDRLVEIITGTHESLAYEYGGRKSDLGRRQVLDRSA